MSGGSTGSPRILVVDDEIATRSALQKLLSARGYCVSTAADGLAALEHLGQHGTDLVVSDLGMPRMGGRELLAEIRARAVVVPVILITSLDDVAAAVTAMRAGAQDYLIKPIDIEELVVAIDRALACREPLNPHRPSSDSEESGLVTPRMPGAASRRQPPERRTPERPRRAGGANGGRPGLQRPTALRQAQLRTSCRSVPQSCEDAPQRSSPLQRSARRLSARRGVSRGRRRLAV